MHDVGGQFAAQIQANLGAGGDGRARRGLGGGHRAARERPAFLLPGEVFAGVGMGEGVQHALDVLGQLHWGLLVKSVCGLSYAWVVPAI
ncbi:MAG: hypothetical protein Q8L84_12380, partial [Hyphomonas sp.]|nr:hypothetical protein [Hyphomonas sp.]